MPGHEVVDYIYKNAENFVSKAMGHLKSKYTVNKE